MARCVWILMLAVLFAAPGCERNPADRTHGNVTPEDVRHDAGQAAKTAAEYSQQTKEEFQKKLEAQLNELDAKIAKLREKGRDMKDEGKVKWDRKMADLEKKRDAARANLAEIGHSSAEAWKDVQKGAQSAWDELDKAFRDASQEF
ncbi:MAG: hypothetical protein ABSG67_13515 [Thermoguttaceae bacterium]